MADIDSLEIQISSDSSQAAENISALVSSLGKLETSSTKAASGLERLSAALTSLKSLSIESNIQGTLESLESSVSAIPRISQILKDAKIKESSFGNIEKLGQAISSLNEIQTPDQFLGAAQAISSASEQISNIDIEAALSNILRLSPALEKLSGALSGMSTAQTQFENMTKNLEKLVGGIMQLSNVDTSYADSVQEFMRKILSVQIDPEYIHQIELLTKAVQRVTNAKPNESAADALRLLIDTIRILTDEDISRLQEVSSLITSMRGMRIPNIGRIQNPIPEDAKSSITEYAETVENAAGIVSISEDSFTRFSDAVDTFGRGALKAVAIEMRAVTAPIRAVGNAFKSAAERVSSFLKSIKRIAFYRAIRSILKSVTQGLQEGRENLYQYSLVAGTEFAHSMDRAATSFLYLKNSIGAATAPLTNYLVPVLEHIVDVVVEVVNGFNEMTAALTGAATWTKALKYPVRWQEAADDANKSAKKLKSTMLGFDELNIIEPKDAGKSGSAAAELDYSKMFTEVKTDLQKEGAIPEIIVPIKAAWDKEGQKTVETVKSALSELLGLVGDIGESFRTVWLNGTGQRTLETLLRITQNIVGAWGGVFKGIRKAWNEGDRGTKIIQNLWNAGNNVLTVFDGIWHSIRNWAEGLNWSPLFSGFEKLSGSLSKLTDPNGGLAKLSTAVVDKFLLPVGKVIIEDALPGAVDLLASAFDGLAIVLELIEPLLSKCAELLGEIGSFTFGNIGGLASGFSALIQAGQGNEISNESAQTVEKAAKKLENIPGFKWIENNVGGFLYDLIGDANHKGYAEEFGDSVAEGWKTISEWWNRDKSKSTEESLGSTAPAIFPMPLSVDDSEKQTEKTRDYINPAIPALGYKEEPEQIEYGKIESGFHNAEKNALRQAKAQRDIPEMPEMDAVENSGFFTDFFDNISSGYDTIGEKLSGFFKDWKSGWVEIESFTSKKWDKITGAFSTGWQGVKTFFSNFSQNWRSGWKDISDWGSEKWEFVKSTLGTGWESLKGKVNDWKDNWNSGMKSIKETVSEKWDSVKFKLGEGWDSFTGKLRSWANDWGIGMNSIREAVRSKWDSVKGTLSDGWSNFNSKLAEWKSNWISGLATIKNEAREKWDWIKDHLTSGWKTLKDKVTDYFDAWSSGFKDVKEWLNEKVASPIKGAWDKVVGTVRSIMPFANGGTVDTGQMFIAREAGPELVGKIGSTTAVMNNTQIVQAVSSGVAQAVASVMSQVMAAQTSNSGSGELSVNVYLDGRQIASSVEKAQARKGVSILGGVNYAT